MIAPIHDILTPLGNFGRLYFNLILATANIINTIRNAIENTPLKIVTSPIYRWIERDIRDKEHI
jgi:hypothetical protein